MKRPTGTVTLIAKVDKGNSTVMPIMIVSGNNESNRYINVNSHSNDNSKNKCAAY